MPKGVYVRTPETRAKLSLAHFDKHHSEETKAKIHDALLGTHPTEKARVNMRLSQTGKHHSEETKTKMRLALLGRQLTEETRIKMSLAKKGKPLSEQQLANIRKTVSSPEYRAKRSQIAKTLWQNPKYRNKVVTQIMLGSHIRPTKPEQQLLELLGTLYPNEWAYVGDGQLIIAGKNPDFANVNGKKQLIEMYGDYFHKGEDPQKRIDIFSQYGYKCLVIWENELAKPKEVLHKIASFTKESWLGKLKTKLMNKSLDRLKRRRSNLYAN